MSRIAYSFFAAFLASLAAASAQESTPAVKVYEVPKEGLKIDGKLNKDDPPLAQLMGAPHQVFLVKLLKGQHYVIELASKDFDAYLILQDALGMLRAHDDDSGGELNSRIAFAATADGTYRVLAAALDRKPGAFQLQVRFGQLPLAQGEEQKLAAEATKVNDEAVHLFGQGRAADAVEKAQQALAIRQKLFPVSRYPDGHLELAASFINLGVMHQSMGQFSKALPYYERALAINQKHYPVAKYPDGHLGLALNLNNLGVLHQSMGQFSKALPYYEKSLAMLQKLHPVSRFPDGHPYLASSLNNLGMLLQLMGQSPKALPYYEQALTMFRKLYPVSRNPNGHPDLARSLSLMGSLLGEMGQAPQALTFSEQSLAMREKLYPASQFPDGHPHLVLSLNNLAGLLRQTVQAPRALPYFEQSLAMTQKLYPASKYPDGHPDLAGSLNNLGALLRVMGHAPKALAYSEQALAMWQKLYPVSKYPDGHPDLARSLDNMGFLLQALDQAPKALPYYEQALAMRQKLGRRILATASEAEALSFVRAQPLMRDVVLSFTSKLPRTDAKTYAAVWETKSAVTRVFAQRQAAARVSGSEHARDLEELKAARRYIDHLLRDTRLPSAERNKLLTKAVDERDALERQLAQAVPLLARGKELDALGPDALSALLPENAVLVDFVRYTHFEFDSAKPGKAGETRTSSYAAFVMAKSPVDRAPDLAVVRIELGAAKPIDRAVAEWRAAIEERTATTATRDLRERVWAKLAPHLPKGTKTLYLALDGDLARMPWAALPIAENRVLLEEYALATMPHGPFLLEALKYPHEYRGPDSTLLLGGIDYKMKTWPNLPGTASEVAALTALAPKPATLTGYQATAKRLIDLLPLARYAHVATHGYFDAETLVAEIERAHKAMESRQMGDDTRRVAAQNPLGFVGLVLADGHVFTGLNLVDLRLENLRLVTLSACETGLGGLTAGEGVQGLQRAFHLAGCPNVVASLWKVNDAATAALMTKFYHEMWVNKKPPIEALREAQLTIYRHPELIPDLAGERGPVRLRNAVAAKASVEASARRATADTKLWAAFVLSGVGK